MQSPTSAQLRRAKVNQTPADVKDANRYFTPGIGF